MYSFLVEIERKRSLAIKKRPTGPTSIRTTVLLGAANMRHRAFFLRVVLVMFPSSSPVEAMRLQA